METVVTRSNYPISSCVGVVSVWSAGESEGDGPPHFTKGMVHEFTVT